MSLIELVAPTPPPSQRWRMLLVLLSGTFMELLDRFIVTVAAPSLQRELHTTDAALELVVAGYAFSYASGLITGGRLGDLFGFRRIFVIGMVGFSVASLLCGLALSPSQLVAARLVQGFAASAMVPQVLSLITATFPVAERARAMSWYGVTIGLGLVSGQVLGGFLLTANLFGLGWRTIFLVNVPVGAIAVGFAWRLLPPGRGSTRPKLDPVGAIGLSGSLALALVPLVLGHSHGWPVWAFLCLGCSIPAMLTIVYWERRMLRRGDQPLLDLSLFGNRSFLIGLASNVAMMAFFGSLLLVITITLQSGMGLSTLQTGLVFLPLGAVLGSTSPVARRLLAKYGPSVITVGSVITALALTLLVLLAHFRGPRTTVVDLIPAMALIGLGQGLAFPSLVGAALVGISLRQAGAASGILITAQQFASAAGVALLGVVFFAALGSRNTYQDFLTALQPVLVLDIILVVSVVFLSRLLPRIKKI
jgi:EmrB/QacA subfamily drug resistance transporter